jgi:carboxymethylenebutenolidase
MTAADLSIRIAAADGSGSFDAFVALPEGGRGPGVVLVQEIFGVNANMRQTAQQYAQAGFVAIVPDLFWRLSPGIELGYSEAERAQAYGLMGRFDVETGLADIQSALDALRSHRACTGQASVVGFCLGGKMAFLAACHTDASASVAYYGVALEHLLAQASGIHCPLVLHIAEQDTLCPPEARAQILAGLAEHPSVSCHVYPGVGHAFARFAGEHLDLPSAALAHERTVATLRQAMGVVLG